MSFELHIVCEPLSTVSSNNRSAQWRWLLESTSTAEARIGQYACGSYWVAPAVGETGVRLLSLTGSGIPGHVDLITLDPDPVLHSHGLLCLGTRTYGSNNAAANEQPDLPILYTPPSGGAISLVSCMQRNEAQTSGGGAAAISGGVADAYCILTVLDAPPPDNGANSIRPNIVGDTKEFLTWDDFDLTRLPAIPFLSATVAPTEMENHRKRWNHSIEVFSLETWNGTSFNSYSEGGRAFRGHILHHNYAGGRAQLIGSACLRLCGALTLAEKKPSLASVIAQGLDIWHAVYGRAGFPGAWSSGAGQWLGQYTASAFAVALLINNAKLQAMRKTAAMSNTPNQQGGPQEMQQIRRGLSGVPLWGDGLSAKPALATSLPTASTTARYWQELKQSGCFEGSLSACNPFIGNKAVGDQHKLIDGPANKPGTNYMGVAAGPTRGLAALMVVFPGVREAVNCDAVIEYAHRLTALGLWTAPDPVAPPPAVDQVGTCNPYEGDGYHACSEFRSTWGPSSSDIRRAVSGSGRFPSLHGTPLNIEYSISVAELNWAAIMSTYDGPTYLTTEVPLTQCVPPDIYTYREGGQGYMVLWAPNFDCVIRYEVGVDEASTPTPTGSSPVYSSPVDLGTTPFIKAITTAAGLADSDVATSLAALTTTPNPLAFRSNAMLSMGAF